MKLIVTLRPPSFFSCFVAANLFCSLGFLGLWAHLFWRLVSLQLKPLTPACSSNWPFPKSGSHADSSSGEHYVDEQDTSAAILFSKNLALIPAVWSNNAPLRILIMLPEYCLLREMHQTQCKLQLQTIQGVGLVNNWKLLLANMKKHVGLIQKLCKLSCNLSTLKTFQFISCHREQRSLHQKLLLLFMLFMCLIMPHLFSLSGTWIHTTLRR